MSNSAEYEQSAGPAVVEPVDRAAPAACEPQCDLPDDATAGDDEIRFEPLERFTLPVLIELILKDRRRLHRVIRDPSLHGELVPRLLAISLIGFVFFGAAMALVLESARTWPQLTPIAEWLNAPTAALIEFAPAATDAEPAASWLDGSALVLIAAYSVGLIAATGVCLPSLYFYGLLAGVRMSMLDVTIHALKSKATAAVALVGILPIYAAVSMGMVIFAAPAAILDATLILGLILPFIAGLWGTRSLYVGFAELCDTMPADRRARRECFLRRLVVSWSACYTAVTPVMIFTIWAQFTA